jgi:hypothetical protein
MSLMSRASSIWTVAFSLVLLAVFVPNFALAGYNQSCTVLEWDPNYPAQVNPTQTVDVTTTIDVSCAQWRTYYSARVDLVDPVSGSLFSTSTFQIGFQPNVTATVSNAAIAPQAAEVWGLQLNLYIFEEGGMVASFKHPISILVGNMNESTQQSTSTSSPSIAQSAATTQESVILETNSAPGTSPSTATGTIYIGLAVVLAFLIVVFTILQTRRSRGSEASDHKTELS